ncbi:TetR/AcrR family transcriptional regulator [Williamsia herbipolensis]|uniref:TetR/AcrR family transcriptional regulator n=2 Tax=Williamsia herbipolensis TaxID=1603258 RepID=A0AAU4JYE7_9NOCA
MDAAFATLVETGYASLTRRGVCERAGLSLGAQQHHFPSKAALVTAAVGQLFERVTTHALSTPIATMSQRETALVLLDRIWEAHNHPLSYAVIDLLVAARTDENLAHTVRPAIDLALASAIQGVDSYCPTSHGPPDSQDSSPPP